MWRRTNNNILPQSHFLQHNSLLKEIYTVWRKWKFKLKLDISISLRDLLLINIWNESCVKNTLTIACDWIVPNISFFLLLVLRSWGFYSSNTYFLRSVFVRQLTRSNPIILSRAHLFNWTFILFEFECFNLIPERTKLKLYCDSLIFISWRNVLWTHNWED